MTGGTLLLGMLADLSRETGGNLRVAQLAPVLKICRCRNRNQGLVGIDMAGKTLHDRFRRTMGCRMAAGTFRHDISIIAAQGIIGMEHLVTVCTGY
jgi:hypothetical protein